MGDLAQQNMASIMPAARPLMSQQTQLPIAQAVTFAPAAPVSKSFVAKAAASVAGHPYASLAIIVVLVIVVIGVFVYYRGLLFLGPYADSARISRSAKGAASKTKRKTSDDDDESGDDKGDPETEKLINAINKN